MTIKLSELLVGLCIIVSVVMPLLYSIVVTALYLKEIRHSRQLQHDYNQLEELADRKIKRLEEQNAGGSRPRKSGKDDITCGFAIPKEDSKEEAQKD